MKLIAQLLVAGAAFSLIGAGAAKADTILDYTFSPDTYYNLSDGSYNTVSGTFSYDVTTQTIMNVDYTRGSDHFTTGSLYDNSSQIYFGPFGTPDYDVFQLQNSLDLGGTDKIVSGTHPDLYVDAGGSLIANAAISAAPEPAAWALMFAGVGLAGAALRTRKSVSAFS
jgi:hypothetical protein